MAKAKSPTIIELWYGNRCRKHGTGLWSWRSTIAEAGEYLRMSDGKVWFHPWTGGAPERCKEFEKVAA